MCSKGTPNFEGNLIRIGCDEMGRHLFYYGILMIRRDSRWNTSHDPNTITVEAPELSSSLKESGCANLYFNFSTPPVNDFNDEIYDLLNTSLSSLTIEM
jgi:hypothetical protein